MKYVFVDVRYPLNQKKSFGRSKALPRIALLAVTQKMTDSGDDTDYTFIKTY